jgi:hypothetical protein
MPDSDEGHWVTYAEAGQMLGISSEAARQMARRRKWPRRTPNEYGALAQVLMPPDAVPVRERPASNGVHDDANGVQIEAERGTGEAQPPAGERPYATPDILRTVQETVEVLLSPIREQLDRSQCEVVALRSELAEARIAERVSTSLAEASGREAVDLRRRLDAEIDERRQLQAKLDALQQPPTPEPPRSRWQRFKAWRRWPIGGLLILCFCAEPAAAQQEFFVLSNGQDSCGEFLAGDHERQMLDLEWILGFISGQNSRGEGPDRSVGRNLPHTDALLAWIKNHCRSHALDALPGIAWALRADLFRRQDSQ